MRRSFILVVVLAGVCSAGALACSQVRLPRSSEEARVAADRIAAVDRRQERMKQMDHSMKALAAYVKGEVADPAQARVAAAVIRGVAQDMGKLWPRGTAVGVGDSKTKPEAWSDEAAFARQIATFRAAADSLNTAAARGDRAAVAQQLDVAGRTCHSCHGAYAKH